MDTYDIVLAGGSGFLGTHLREHLTERGHRVTTLVRRPAESVTELTWDPYAGPLDPAALDGVDAVINLAGSPTAGNPHSKSWARELRHSRVTTTRVLAEAIAACSRPPAFLAGNGISYYGDHGSEPLPETADTRGDALLTSVTRDWQAATEPAAAAGSRVCILRTSPVLDRRSAPLKQLRLLFLAGLGGPIGSGEQYFPVISLRDWVRATTHVLETDSISGPVNLCSAQTATNREYTLALARALKRPAFAKVPSKVVRVAGGEMAPEVLGSINARPAALLDSGFEFSDPTIADVITAGLSAANP